MLNDLKWLSRLALTLLSTLLAVALAEGGHRAWLALEGEPYSAEAAREELLVLADPSRLYVPEPAEPAEDQEFVGRPVIVLHPYTGSENGHDTGGVLEYFREHARPKHFSVLVLGGSFAASFSNEPLLRERLSELPALQGRRVRVLNYAHAAFKQPQQLMRLAYLFSLGYRPDAVIHVDGFNEVALPLQGLSRGIHPVYPQYIRWGIGVQKLDDVGEREMHRRLTLYQLSVTADELVAQAEAWGVCNSSLLGGLWLTRMRELNAQRFQLLAEDEPEPPAEVDRQIQGPDFDHGHEAVLETCARNWVESSLSMAALCERRGIPYLHVLQPTLHDEGAKPLSEEERGLPLPNKGWLRGAREGYPLLRERAPELLAAGVDFHDASRIFAADDRTLFVDACHVNHDGNRALVDPVVGWFAELLE